MFKNYIKSVYGVPSNRGRKVSVYWKVCGSWMHVVSGKITSWPWDKELHINGLGPYHPLVGVVYYGKGGKVLRDTRKDFTSHPHGRSY